MYQVIWRRSALLELAALWGSADSALRESITKAAAAIDAMLKKSPDTVGESRPDNRRIAFEDPLGFTFEIRSADKHVVVGHVWSIARTKS